MYRFTVIALFIVCIALIHVDSRSFGGDGGDGFAGIDIGEQGMGLVTGVRALDKQYHTMILLYIQGNGGRGGSASGSGLCAGGRGGNG
jgi:hypothetical protein